MPRSEEGDRFAALICGFIDAFLCEFQSFLWVKPSITTHFGIHGQV